MAFDVLAEYAVGQTPQQLILAQFDGDSQPDLVTVENSTVKIRLGNDDGSFSDPIAPANGEIYANRIATGDFNNDGKNDLVTTISLGQVALRMGNGNGTFGEPQLIALPAQLAAAYPAPGYYHQSPYSIAVGDLNNDGKLDLTVGGFVSYHNGLACGYYSCGYSDAYEGYVNVLIGNGTGQFQYEDARPSDPDLNAYPLGVWRLPYALAVADLNHDNRADVLVSASGLSTLLGNGDGSLQGAISSGAGSTGTSIPLGDVDGDGNLDAVSLNGNSLLVQKGLGDGRFSQGTSVDTGQRLQSAVIGDVNADGKLDLVAVGTALCSNYSYYGCYDPTTTKQVSVLLGNGQGGFSLPITSSLGTATDFYSSFVGAALADLTGDGLPELLALDARYGGSLAIVAVNDGNWVSPVEITISDATVVEGNSVNAVFTVTRSSDTGTAVSVSFATADYYFYPTATAGEDYTPQSGTLTFGPGVLSQTISVPVLDDRLGEGNEIFSVKLSNPVGGRFRNALGVGTIVDNEPTISIDHLYYNDPLTVVEGDTGTKPAVFTVSLSQAYDQEVTVHYYTSTGNINDIVAADGTLRFAPGDTTKTITVQVVGDTLSEALEAFNVILDTPSANASIGNADGYCYIEDNDPAATVSISDVSKNEGNSGTTKFNFKLTLSTPTDGGYVEFATADGTATTGNQDYTAKSGYVYFNAGQTTQTISIDVKGDKTAEANETFFVNLVSAGGVMIAAGQAVGTIVNDDGAVPAPLPLLSIDDAQVTEGNSGTKLLTFTVSLSQASSKEVRVNYATANGTAKTSNNDYVATSGTLKFSPGQTSKTITVKILGDTKSESDEYFLMKLSGAVNGEISDSEGLGTILNDDKSAKTRAEKQPKSSAEKQPKAVSLTQAQATDAVFEALWVLYSKKRGK